MERVPFFSKERGTEHVPEIRGTTKALDLNTQMLSILEANFQKQTNVYICLDRKKPMSKYDKIHMSSQI